MHEVFVDVANHSLITLHQLLKKGYRQLCCSYWCEQKRTTQYMCTSKHQSLLRYGDVRNISTADVVVLETSLHQMWWCWKHLYSRCDDVRNISMADLVIFVTSVQQMRWCW